MSLRNVLNAGLLGALLLSFAACSKTADKAAVADAAATQVAGHSHSDWWCPVHGVPEAQCAQCDAKLAADMKAKGDWCEEHNRPESQCFICNPEKEAEFAALYEAKFGTAPPKRAAEAGETGDAHADHNHS